MKFHPDLIDEYKRLKKKRCEHCERRVNPEDMYLMFDGFDSIITPPEVVNACPYCQKEAELYDEDITEYIDGEGYELKDCLE